MSDPDHIESLTFTCQDCDRRLTRLVDVELTDRGQARRVARALGSPPDLCFACALHPGWQHHPDFAHGIDRHRHEVIHHEH